ncbi:MAG: AAA family ATPase [Candidatus Moraniibacteriota bacterium]
MEQGKIIIGIAGEMASGKDTVTDYIVEKYGGREFGFSDSLRDMLDRLHLAKDRDHLTRLSMALRNEFGQDLLAKIIDGDAKSAPEKIAVIDGVRRPMDIVILRKNPEFSLIYVDADFQIRYERIKGRGQNSDDSTKTIEDFKKDHLLETEVTIPALRDGADFIVNNDKTLEELHAQVDSIMEQLMRKSDGSAEHGN